MKTYEIEWERRVADVAGWRRVLLHMDPTLTMFEIQSMAAGLRAEVRNIRNVQIREITEVTRYLV